MPPIPNAHPGPGTDIPRDAPNDDDPSGPEALSRRLGETPDAAAARALALLDHAERSGDPRLRARALVLVADSRFRAGATVEALELFQTAVELAEGSGDPAVLVSALVAQAGKLGDLGRTGDALEAGMRARALASDLGPLLLARATHAVGWTLLRARDLDRAETWAALARRHAEASGHALLRYAAISLQGGILKEQERFSEALALFELALEDARPELDDSRIGAILANIGNCLKGLGRIDEALAHLDEALVHIDRAGHKLNRAGLLMHIGRTHLERRDADAAIPVLERALEAIEQVGHEVWLYDCLSSLADAHALRGDYEAGFHALRRSARIERACLREQRSTKVGELEARQKEAEQRRLKGELSRALTDVEAARARSEAHADAISAFLAVTSHEIRTPLTGVLGLADLLAEEPLPPEWRENVEMIRASGRIVLGVVNDILDFNRLASGKLELDPVHCSLPEATFQAMQPYLRAASGNGLTLSLEVDTGTPLAVMLDDRRFSQVVGNLCSNALRFTPSGSVTVRLAPLGKRRVRVEVLDTGVGLSDEDAKRLFQPFVQADRRTSRDHGGSGLGLTICRQLVELFPGRIGASGRLGQGSVFWFEVELPAIRSRTPRAHRVVLTEGGRLSAALRVDQQPVARSWLCGDVLVVEDNAINQRVVVGLLASLGARAVVAESGEAALQALSVHTFDIILMDGELPGIDGWETTRRLRQTDPDTPVYALTASLLDQVRDRCEAAGMVGLIAKPVTRDELLEALSPVLGVQPDEAEPAAV